MKQILTYCLILAGVFTFSNGAFAQEDLPDSMTITIVKEYRPVARDAQKILSNPKMDFDTTKPATPTYSVLPDKQDVDLEVESINAAKLSNEPLQKLFRGYAKVGFGNYTMPLVKVGIGSLRSKKFQYGFDYSHFSSAAKRDGVPFGFGENYAKLYGSFFMKKHVIKAQVEYDRDVAFRYGYDTTRDTFSRDDIRQRYSTIGTAVEFYRNPNLDLKIFDRIGLSYHNTQDLYGSQENAAGLNFTLKENIKKSEIHFLGGVDYFHNMKPLDTTNNVFVNLSPRFKTQRQRWSIMIGVTLGLDVQDSNTKVLVFPELDFNYFIVKDIFQIYAGATGGIKRNGLREFSQTNPYVGMDQPMLNSWDRLNIFAGFKGSITSKIGFDIGVSEKVVNQHLFWRNDYRDWVGNSFVPEYYNVRILTLKGELYYTLKDKLFVSAAANYRFFTMPGDHLEPWHEAPFNMHFKARYSLKDKIIARIDLFAFGPRSSTEIEYYGADGIEAYVEKPITLKGTAELNIGVEYRYRRWIGAFVDLRNIAFQRYQIYNRYDSQRMSFIAGLNFTF